MKEGSGPLPSPWNLPSSAADSLSPMISRALHLLGFASPTAFTSLFNSISTENPPMSNGGVVLQSKIFGLFLGVSNPKADHSSKAIVEPPFFLASAVFFAIKDAIASARGEEGLHGWFPLDSPATPERIRMACADDFTKPLQA